MKRSEENRGNRKVRESKNPDESLGKKERKRESSKSSQGRKPEKLGYISLFSFFFNFFIHNILLNTNRTIIIKTKH